MAALLPPVIFAAPCSHAPQGGSEHPASAQTHSSQAGEQRGTDSRQGPAVKKSSSEECPSHPGAGASGPQPPPLPFPPTPPGTHTIGASVHGDASWQQEKLHGDAGVRHTELWMAAAEAAGSLTRKRRTKPALFLFLVFFPEPNRSCAPSAPIHVGEGCPKWGGGFFFFKKVIFKFSVERVGRGAVERSPGP